MTRRFEERAVRPAEPGEVGLLARVWFDAWRDAHLALVPVELARVRTLEDFAQRLPGMLADIRVAGPPGAPIGFCALEDDELQHLFVAATARGSGVAAVLLADGEARLRARRVAVAWLTCAVGNHRAARFYEKNGWTCTGTEMGHALTPAGTFGVPVWRYEKSLRP